MTRVVLAVALLIVHSASLIAQRAEPPAADRVVTVMTRNVDHGVLAELQAASMAVGQADLLQKVAEVYQAYFTRNFHERAAALAREIDAACPDLIGLQEAVLVRTQAPPDGAATPATTVALDYVEILLDALAARGLLYEVVVQSIGWDIELPSALGFDVRHTDREVILARADLRVSDLKLSNAQAGNFVANCQIPTNLFGLVTILRGWASVDVQVRGKSFRFVTTHLDGDCLPFTSAFQQAQAAELLGGPAATGLPVVLVGDLNSPGDGTGVTYNSVMAAGFSDAAVIADLGHRPTCCQADNLLNEVSLLDRRIDFVLFRGDFSVRAAAVLGDDPADRTPSGLWPSDHAGVAARLTLPR
jgi:endonuclease/exonuclease/phosphatase family metal-dependent hydrolase